MPAAGYAAVLFCQILSKRPTKRQGTDGMCARFGSKMTTRPFQAAGAKHHMHRMRQGKPGGHIRICKRAQI